jgi:hypothetical protein
MARFIISSSGLLAEIAHIGHLEETSLVILSALGLWLSLCVWYSEMFRFVDHMIGNDCESAHDSTAVEVAGDYGMTN